MQGKRKLSIILFADIAGYTAMMQQDEEQALTQLNHFRDTLMDFVPAHQGEIIQYFGDGCLLAFESATKGVTCAISLQQAFTEHQIPVRIGMHMGEVLFKNGNAFGDSVNVASRIESMGVPGSILISKVVKNQIQNKTEFSFASLGSFHFKNVSEPMEVFGVANEKLVVPTRKELKSKGKQRKQSGPIWPSLTIAGLLVAALLFAGLSYFSGKSSQTPAKNEFGITNTLAVFPFDVKGSPDIQYLGDGIVDLISTQLDEIPSIHSVDPNLLFSKLDNTNAISRFPEKAAELSASFGATEFILGSIVEIDDDLQFSATKYRSSGEKLSTETIRGDQKNGLTVMIDELVKRLIAADLKESGHELGSLAVLTSNNPESLKLYLQGEQAFRLADMDKASKLFEQATQLDSTFALAWMRAYEYNWSWFPPPVLKQKWAQYKHMMPQKWQEYYGARELERQGDLNAIKYYEYLNQKYGETYTFTYRIGEFMFHSNPIYGRSSLEAKPYFLKTLELDVQNLEAMFHLGAIALMENDSVELQALLARTDPSSPAYDRLKTYELRFRDADSVADTELLRLGNHEGFRFPKGNEAMDFTLMERVYELEPSSFGNGMHNILKFGLAGKDQELYNAYREFAIIAAGGNWRVDIWQYTMPAVLIADLDYLPMSEYYEEMYQESRLKETPWEVYAAIKYGIMLNKNQEVGELKQKLRTLSTSPELEETVNFYDYSIQAFEARLNGENELALAYIDSAYNSPFDAFDMMISCYDKTIIAANIYAEKGELEKAISHFGPIYPVLGEEMLRGYGTYKLSQWYEEIGDTENALAKCNLFLESYKDCDEKYMPLVEEVQERQNRLIAKMN